MGNKNGMHKQPTVYQFLHDLVTTFLVFTYEISEHQFTTLHNRGRVEIDPINLNGRCHTGRLVYIRLCFIYHQTVNAL